MEAWMNTWASYPATYRQAEVQRILATIQRGGCVAVIGLSGAGKSNLLGFLARRVQVPDLEWVLLDGNRLQRVDAAGFWQLVGAGLGCGDEVSDVEAVLSQRLHNPQQRVCLVMDRFDALPKAEMELVAGNLRALRDSFKYQLGYVVGVRRALLAHSELAELFFAGMLWLGPLAQADALWSVAQFANRAGLNWPIEVQERIYQLSGGYASLLRAICEAFADGVELEEGALCFNPSVQARLNEFWADQPDAEALRLSGLEHHAWLSRRADEELTALEHRLLEALRANSGEVCEKDDLIRMVWREDQVFERGVRDDSLAQLVRRLRQKIGSQAIQTLPGRGYRLIRGNE